MCVALTFHGTTFGSKILGFSCVLLCSTGIFLKKCRIRNSGGIWNAKIEREKWWSSNEKSGPQIHSSSNGSSPWPNIHELNGLISKCHWIFLLILLGSTILSSLLLIQIVTTLITWTQLCPFSGPFVLVAHLRSQEKPGSQWEILPHYCQVTCSDKMRRKIDVIKTIVFQRKAWLKCWFPAFNADNFHPSSGWLFVFMFSKKTTKEHLFCFLGAGNSFYSV